MTRKTDDVRIGPAIELDTDDSEVCSVLLIRPSDEGNVVMYLANDNIAPIMVDRIFVLDPKSALQIAAHMERLALEIMGGVN